MVVINARFLTQERRGAQRFAEAVSLELKRQRKDVVFVSPAGVMRESTAEALDIQQIGRSRGALWEQLELPLWLARNSRPLLLSLGNTAPALYRNQIVTHHDLSHVHHPQGHSAASRLGYRLLLPTLLRRSRALLTVSEFSRDQIAEQYGYPAQHISVISNAAAGCFRPAANEPIDSPPYLLAVCSLRAHKNLERAIAAFLSIRGAEDTELRIVDGEASGLSLPDFIPLTNPRVRLLGRLSDKELLAQYRGARALVLPSLYEGFGMPALEAQASGCPVLAACTPALKETLGESALFFNPQDVPEMALCMRRVLHEPALRAQLRARGLQNAQRYCWKSAAAKVSQLLDAALAQTQGAGTGLLHLPLSEH